MSIEHIESGEKSAAFTGVRLMLTLLSMAQEIGFRLEGLVALNAIVGSSCCDTTMT